MVAIENLCNVNERKKRTHIDRDKDKRNNFVDKGNHSALAPFIYFFTLYHITVGKAIFFTEFDGVLTIFRDLHTHSAQRYHKTETVRRRHRICFENTKKIVKPLAIPINL